MRTGLFSLALVLFALFGAAAAAQDQEKKAPPRYGFTYNPELYPQKKPQDALKSILKANDDKRVDYLLAQLADPKFVDAQVEDYQASVGKGDPALRSQVAFDRFVSDTIAYFRADPVLIKELRRFARDGMWEVEGMLATATLKGSPRKVFFKQIGDRWFLENRQQ